MSRVFTVFIASDHAGFELKKILSEYLIENGHTVVGFGANDGTSCDYPPIAQELCSELLKHQNTDQNCFGVLICGTGIGMSITANRIKGIRAALCTHEFHAKASREHNDANVICLGERISGVGLALSMLETFMNTSFADGRHKRRIDLID
ncbi:ribose 5-phosphate isomerase B [Desulfovibrio litoralis]|uniref:Ribose-5-phosphate isomerase n=1 Tax=Desulfovibrio litoralis DSM 11393 TaxID=1121455 RepID=A0A1M7SM96_9BACT|nr:ribose 5-phosphate isomerase B [Desulfovibrio litoralis]SHN59597.1 ribose-5-phosphate isomerase [Desulfovibrio litoralis DSM 11393]